MNWTEIVENPTLQDLPFKLETNKWGQIVMSAATNRHGFLQGRIVFLLCSLNGGGNSFPECSIETSDGVKVPDVVWCSADFLMTNGYETPYQTAPEICVEIVSRSNSKREMTEKRRLYFERGAKECWLCYENGAIEFYGFDHKKRISKSALFPDFPAQIKVSWS